MSTRRDFTFGGLVLALTGATAARANQPAKAAPKLGWSHRVSHRKGKLTVHVSVTNQGDESLEVVAALGDGPGAYVSASIDIEGEPLELARVMTVDRRKVLMSRRGPIPEWRPLAQGASLELGPYEFAWPKGVPPTAVRLTADIDTINGRSEYRATVEPDAAAKTTS